MTKETYKSIRNKKTFLYQYYIEETGVHIPEAQFSVLFGAWLNRFGVDNDKLVRKIIAFLDKKFAYK